MEYSDFPSSPTTGYAPAPSTPTNESGNTKKPSTWRSFRRIMLGVIGVLSMIVLLQTCAYTYGTLDNSDPAFAATTTRIRTQSISIDQQALPDERNHSWMDRIVARRTMIADVSHQMKATAHDRIGKKGQNGMRGDGRVNDDMLVDLSILRTAVVETVRDVGVRGLLFEVLSDDFEYYVYSDESIDAEENDDDYSEIDAYWEYCYSNHGVGDRCNEWDVWWTYHYIGAIVTDMLLGDHQLLWDGSSGEVISAKISTCTNSSDDCEETDAAMAELLDRIHSLQASLPYVTQSSFHAQHALIWRYVERAPERLAKVYPWDLAVEFCRGDGSRPKGIKGRPVNKGIDHECFHGFGHAMFYAVASKQLKKDRKEHNQNNNESEFLFLRPHSGFELSQESYCEIHELCKGASPPSKKRKILDPNDEASSNSYRICLEGVVHSVRLTSNDYEHMTKKKTAIETVKNTMEQCERRI